MLGHWKAIGCDAKVLSWLAYGRKLRFHAPLEELAFPNPRSVFENAEFVEKECLKALAEGSSVLVDYSYARVINPILVDTKRRNGKKRMCLDLRYPNSETAAALFRLATLLKSLPHQLRPDDVLFTADLEQAYHSVPMHESAWPYMVFDSPLGLMTPTVLSFGDGVAPFTFHKITRPMVAFAQLAGLRLMSYLDDFLFMTEPARADSTRTFAKWLLPFLGWVVNEDKSDWSSGTAKESLGFIVDSADMRLRVPADKIASIAAQITEALTPARTTVGILHSIWGRIQSLYPALQGASAYCSEIGRQVVAENAQGKEGSDEVLLTGASRAELVMLRGHVQAWGPRGLPIPSLLRQEVMWSDAGEFGYGGHLKEEKAEHASILPSELIGTSSTRRELYGLRKVALRLGESLRGKKVLFLLDSRAGVHNMLNQGGSIRELNEGFRVAGGLQPARHRTLL